MQDASALDQLSHVSLGTTISYEDAPVAPAQDLDANGD